MSLLKKHKNEIETIVKEFKKMKETINKNKTNLNNCFGGIILEISLKSPEIPKIDLGQMFLQEFNRMIKNHYFLNYILKDTELEQELDMDFELYEKKEKEMKKKICDDLMYNDKAKENIDDIFEIYFRR